MTAEVAVARRSALVADDSVAVRRLVAAVLRRDGYDVREAEDGAAAWREIEERPPDLLVVDDVLPALSGAELVAAVHARADVPAVRVAFLVEYPSGLIRAARAGLDEHAVIRKPFDLDELSQQLGTLAC